ncbi:MAG: nucleotide exchange factor GrpE [Pseudomonadales bacterium]|nr:nucleotide exchange factor GrpE [Pseudomonadales bacterium]
MTQEQNPGRDSELDPEKQASVDEGPPAKQEAAEQEGAEQEGTEQKAEDPVDNQESQAELDGEEAEADAETLAAELAQLKDQVLRSLAEVENVKRRATRDVENAHKFATEKLINDLFPVIDSLEKAVETANSIDGAESISEGVALSLKLFVDTLGKSGVDQIDPLGEPFDPQLHEAMTMVPNPDAEPNSIMDVMAKGYVLNGRLVRAAKVIVVKGD